MDLWSFHCKIVGVDPKATQAEIKRAYIEAAKLLHPDKHQNSAASTARFQQLQESYEYLKRNYAKSRPDPQPSHQYSYRPPPRPEPQQSHQYKQKPNPEPTPKHEASKQAPPSTGIFETNWIGQLIALVIFIYLFNSFKSPEPAKSSDSKPKTAVVELGRLTVHSNPEGAEILLDDVSVGTTPAVLDVPMRTRVVLTLKLDEYKTSSSLLFVNQSPVSVNTTLRKGRPGSSVVSYKNIEIVDSSFHIGTDKNDKIEWAETDRVPFIVGEIYGWSIHLGLAPYPLKMKVTLTGPSAPKTWGRVKKDTTRMISADGRTGTWEWTETAPKGWIHDFWDIAPGDPKGDYQSKVYINDQLARVFNFKLE